MPDGHPKLTKPFGIGDVATLAPRSYVAQSPSCVRTAMGRPLSGPLPLLLRLRTAQRSQSLDFLAESASSSAVQRMQPAPPRVHRLQAPPRSSRRFLHRQRSHPFVLLRRPRYCARNQCPTLSVCVAHSPSGFVRMRHTTASIVHRFQDMSRNWLAAMGLSDLAPPLRIACLKDSKSAHIVAGVCDVLTGSVLGLR
jgi:hypothetical protein